LRKAWESKAGVKRLQQENLTTAIAILGALRKPREPVLHPYSWGHSPNSAKSMPKMETGKPNLDSWTGQRADKFVDPMEEPKKAKFGFLLLGAILVDAIALLFFGWLAEEVLEADTERFDTLVRTVIHRFASPPITSVMEVVSLLGSVGVLLLLSLLAVSLFYYFHRPRAATFLAITMAGTAALDLVLKHAFHRVRPLAFFGSSPSSYSFPSGHALGSLCFYGALAAILSARIASRRARSCIWAIAVLIVGMIGFSRVYLGLHYPSDVIAGYCAAIVWVGTVGFLDRIFEREPTEKTERLART
jgi:undecaprenyl-diphosphatase